MSLALLLAFTAVTAVAWVATGRLKRSQTVCDACSRRSGHEVRGHSDVDCLSSKPCHHGCTSSHH